MLSSKEWLLINDIILIIHSTDDTNIMMKYFFDSIKPLVLYEKAMFYMLKEKDNNIELLDPVLVNTDLDFFKAYENLFKNSRYGRIAINCRQTVAFRDRDLIPESVYTNTDIYKSFLLPYNLPYGGGMIIADNKKLLAEISLYRTKELGDFTDKEIYILDILKSHIQIKLRHEDYFINKKEQIEDKTTKLIELGLTNREIEVIKLVVDNLSTEEITSKLNISIYTTKKHISNIFAKLKINNRLQLIKLFSNL